MDSEANLNAESVRAKFVNVEDSMSEELMAERRAEAARNADYVRNYSLTFQVVVTVIGDEETDWEDVDAQMEDTGSYTLLAPWESDIIAVIRNG